MFAELGKAMASGQKQKPGKAAGVAPALRIPSTAWNRACCSLFDGKTQLRPLILASLCGGLEAEAAALKALELNHPSYQSRS